LKAKPNRATDRIAPTLDPGCAPAPYGGLYLDGLTAAVAELPRTYSHGFCEHPVRLTGSRVDLQKGTGEVEDFVLYTACKTRKAGGTFGCKYCSTIYSNDVRTILKSGMDGYDCAFYFVTLTAPGFGKAKGKGTNPHHQLGECKCEVGFHGEGAPEIGAPIDPDNFNYEAAARWHETAPALWARTMKELRRERKRQGLDPHWGYFRIVESQKRGVIHYHAVFRGTPLSRKAMKRIIRRVKVNGQGWGSQTRIEYIAPKNEAAQWKVIKYLSKYLTKSFEEMAGHGHGELGKHTQRLQSAGHKQAVKTCDRDMNHSAFKCRRCNTAYKNGGFRGTAFSKSNSKGAKWGMTLRECRQRRQDFMCGGKPAASEERFHWLPWKYRGKGFMVGDQGHERIARLYASGEHSPPPKAEQSAQTAL
jgi:hypothetical protein